SDDEGPGGALGKNPPGGVAVSYWLKEKPSEKEPLTIEFLDGEKVIRTYTTEKKDKDKEESAGPGEDETADKPIEAKAGVNRLTWDMRILKPALIPKAVVWGTRQGPRVAPGSYSVRLKYAGATLTQPVEVRRHPEASASDEDLKNQFRLLSDVRDRIEEAHDAVARIRDAKAQAQAIGERAEKLGKGTALKEKGKTLSEKLTSIEKKLVNPDLKSNQDVLNFPPALDHQLIGIAVAASSADSKPTDSSWTYYKEVSGKLASILAELDQALGKDLADFNALVRKEEIPPVVVVSKKKSG
ncbi:MAG TPA: hypothetical protein VF999_05755, partial [Thermoanaerobaculia bacterium]